MDGWMDGCMICELNFRTTGPDLQNRCGQLCKLQFRNIRSTNLIPQLAQKDKESLIICVGHSVKGVEPRGVGDPFMVLCIPIGWM